MNCKHMYFVTARIVDFTFLRNGFPVAHTITRNRICTTRVSEEAMFYCLIRPLLTFRSGSGAAETGSFAVPE